MNRRDMLQLLAGGSALSLQTPTTQAQPGPTKFQHACMTLPYAAFPLERALKGIAAAGYKYVAWGTTHMESSGNRRPVIGPDASAADAKALATRCRNLGLEPVMMFSEIYVAAPDSVKVHTRRVEQAAAAGMPFVLTFGSTKTGEYDMWIKNLKQLGPIARNAGVMIVIKQHGGNTATGKDCQKIVSEVNDPGVKICYDAGNVLDYESTDPLPDIKTCLADIRGFCIKDHRDFPKDEDCGPGYGEIDHYKLFANVMNTGLTMPLAYENIFEPLIARPTNPDRIDVLARRSREYMESVLAGLQTVRG